MLQCVGVSGGGGGGGLQFFYWYAALTVGGVSSMQVPSSVGILDCDAGMWPVSQHQGAWGGLLGVARCPSGRWDSDPVTIQLEASGPDVCVAVCVCMCWHESVSLLVSPCVPTASLVGNSWLPPSAAPLHQQPHHVYMLCVSLPCHGGLLLPVRSTIRRGHRNVITADLRSYIVLQIHHVSTEGAL